jgi:phosphoribosylanthranilate isomerase
MFATDRKTFLCIPADWVSITWRKKGKLVGSFMALPKNGAVMVDSGNAEQRGGSGKPFDWHQARVWVSLMGQHYPIVIAGGLNSDNVSNAIGILKPWGVDVVSGVEARPGKKDSDKVRAFVKAVRDFDRKSS